jgi:hypothetical protein
VFLLSEFLEGRQARFRRSSKALIGHCHHKAIMKMTAEEAVLCRMGIDFGPRPDAAEWRAGSVLKDKYEVLSSCRPPSAKLHRLDRRRRLVAASRLPRKPTVSPASAEVLPWPVI